MKHFIDNDNQEIQDECEKKSVVIYARESNHPGADESLNKQKENLKAFCKKNGYLIADEVATIGSREDSLSALKRAVESAKNTNDKTLLIASTNRVVGTHKEVTEIAELVEEAGVTIATMDGTYEAVLKYGTSPSMLITNTLSAIDTDE